MTGVGQSSLYLLHPVSSLSLLILPHLHLPSAFTPSKLSLPSISLSSHLFLGRPWSSPLLSHPFFPLSLAPACPPLCSLPLPLNHKRSCDITQGLSQPWGCSGATPPTHIPCSCQLCSHVNMRKYCIGMAPDLGAPLLLPAHKPWVLV